MLNQQNSPPNRAFPGLTYDRKHKKTVLYGGAGGFTDTWVYDLASNTWTNMNPSNSPPPSTGLTEGTATGPALTYDSVNGVVLAFIPRYLAGRVLETWAYDLDTNTWTKKSSKPTTLIGHRGGDTLATFLRDYNTAMVMDLGSLGYCPNTSSPVCSETWMYRYGIPEPDSLPKPPTDLSVYAEPGQVKLNWSPSPSPNVIGYNIYRGIGTKPWEVSYSKINNDPIVGTSYTDTQGIRSGNIYFYFLRAVDDQGRESKDSIKVRTQPQIIKQAVVSVLNANQVKITWEGSLEPDVVGYNIYRAECNPGICSAGEKPPYDNFICPRAMVYYGFNPGTFSKINPSLVTGTTYIDNVNLQGSGTYPYKVYAYIIRAVNKLGVESGPSPYWPTIPSAPTQLKFKEEGNKIYLKWAPNPEENIQGYRVYRMGPAYSYTLTELTTEPIQATSFTDPDCGNGHSITYYVTAIDALGQEGIPSARALIHRGYKSLWDDNHYLDEYYISELLITTSDLPTGVIGTSYSQNLSASGGMAPYYWSISSGNLPPGLSLSSDGIISGIPTTEGKYSFTVKVTDSSSLQEEDTRSFSINIVPEGTDIDPPVITDITASNITANSATISWQTNEPATSQVEYGTSPSYGNQTEKDTTLKIAHSVSLSDLAPNTLYHYKVVSEDEAGNSRSVVGHTFTTADPNAPPSVSILATPNAGVAPLTVHFTSSVTGGAAISSYHWDLGDGTNSPEPDFIHEYTTKGFYTVTLTVTDTNGNTGQDSTQVYVYGSEDELQIISINPSYCDMVTLVEGVSYRPEPAWSAHKITSVPSQYVGLPLIRIPYNDKDKISLDYLSFIISKKANVYVAYDGDATPPNWLTNEFTDTGEQLKVTHGYGPMKIWKKTFDSGTVILGGNAASGASGYDNMYTVFIEEYKQSFKITVDSLPNGTVGTEYSATLSASGGIPPYTWSISSGSLPNGLTLDSSTGILSGTPTQTGTFTFTIQVKDSNNNTSTKEFTLTINPAQLTGDLNQDNKVNSLDFQILIQKFKQTQNIETEDLNSDGIVDVKDIGILMHYWTN